MLALGRSLSAAPELKVAETLLAPAPAGEVFISPDGRHWAAVRERNNRFCVVIDGQEGKPYDWIAQQQVTFTADSALAVYVAKDLRKSLLVTNTTEGPRHEAIDHFVTSSTGRRIAYAARRGQRMVAIVDGRESAEYAAVRFDAISGSLAPFIAVTEKGEGVVVDGKPGPAREEITALYLSPDGRHIACRVRKGPQWLLVIDNAQELPCDETSIPIFSPDARHLAYIVSRSGREALILDGQAIAEHAHIRRDVAFSPDSRRLAYVAGGEHGQTLFLHADGRSAPAGREHDGIESPRFSPDGKRLACVVRNAGQSTPLIDGVPGLSFDSLAASTLTWSPDGHHAACLAQRGDKSRLAIDTAQTPAYERIITPPRIPFDSPHSLHFLAIKDKQLLRIRVELNHR